MLSDNLLQHSTSSSSKVGVCEEARKVTWYRAGERVGYHTSDRITQDTIHVKFSKNKVLENFTYHSSHRLDVAGRGLARVSWFQNWFPFQDMLRSLEAARLTDDAWLDGAGYSPAMAWFLVLTPGHGVRNACLPRDHYGDLHGYRPKGVEAVQGVHCAGREVEEACTSFPETCHKVTGLQRFDGTLFWVEHNSNGRVSYGSNESAFRSLQVFCGFAKFLIKPELLSNFYEQ